MEKSLWQKDNTLKDFKPLDGNIETDILIIGAGMTGVTTAYNLIDSKLKITLIDRNKCFNEVTAKSTGKVTYLQDLRYQDIMNVYDFETAKLYYESQKDAIRIIKKNVKDNEMECSLEKVESVTFTLSDKEIPKFEAEEKFFDALGVKYYRTSASVKDERIKRLIMVKNTYVFNPVRYLKGLMKEIKKNDNISVYEQSVATKIKKEDGYYVALVNDYEVKAKKIVIACNYPFFTLPGLTPLKTYLEKSYICASRVEDVRNVSAITSNYPTISFRYYEEKENKYFIYLNNSSKISDKLNYKNNYDKCVSAIKQVTGKAPTFKWTNMDVMTHDSLPLVGKISDDEPNVYLATGYNTWGMTGSTIAAKIVCDLIKNKSNKYAEVFSPSRKTNVKKLKNFVVDTMFSNTKAYTLNLIKKNPSWYKNRAAVTKINGKRVGVYFDKDGNKHVVSNICPHLKCFLTFNMVDKTWDCPCHGSRFDIDGNAIKGPSAYDIKIDETTS